LREEELWSLVGRTDLPEIRISSVIGGFWLGIPPARPPGRLMAPTLHTTGPTG